VFCWEKIAASLQKAEMPVLVIYRIFCYLQREQILVGRRSFIIETDALDGSLHSCFNCHFAPAAACWRQA
jgi:hypothetical protein